MESLFNPQCSHTILTNHLTHKLAFLLDWIFLNNAVYELFYIYNNCRA